jgi:hypothetical protein
VEVLEEQESLKYKPEGWLSPYKVDLGFCLGLGDGRAVALTQNVGRPGVAKPKVKPRIANTLWGMPQVSKLSGG